MIRWREADVSGRREATHSRLLIRFEAAFQAGDTGGLRLTSANYVVTSGYVSCEANRINVSGSGGWLSGGAPGGVSRGSCESEYRTMCDPHRGYSCQSSSKDPLI